MLWISHQRPPYQNMEFNQIPLDYSACGGVCMLQYAIHMNELENNQMQCLETFDENKNNRQKYPIYWSKA